MAPSALARPHDSFAAYGIDPFRDPYSMLGRDPLRELMRLNPLGSLVKSKLERAKVLCLADYPSLPGGLPPGYASPTTHSMMSKISASPYSSLYTSASLPGLSLGHSVGHAAMGLNGVPGAPSQYASKDPLRR